MTTTKTKPQATQATQATQVTHASRFTTIRLTVPAYALSYLYYGDAEGLTQTEIDALEAYLDDYNLLDCAAAFSVPEGNEPYFTWYFSKHGGTCQGGQVIDIEATVKR